MSHFARYFLIVLAVLAIAAIAVAYRSVYAPHKKPSTSSHATVSVYPARSKESRIVIHETDARGIVHLAKGNQFVVSLGNDLSWKLVFSPDNLVTSVLGTSTRAGIQGVYVAAQVGTTTLTAIGSPICTSGNLCPQFREQFSVLLDIQSSAL